MNCTRIAILMAMVMLLGLGCSKQSSESALSDAVGWAEVSASALQADANAFDKNIAFVLTEEDKGCIVQVLPGTVFQVLLEANWSTGSVWYLESPFDSPPLKLIDSGEIVDPLAPPGSPCWQYWTFRAMSQGTTDIALIYIRPWDPDTILDSATYTIVVSREF